MNFLFLFLVRINYQIILYHAKKKLLLFDTKPVQDINIFVGFFIFEIRKILFNLLS
jgi:hypothetical protein